jgi:hypothetical protein
MQQMQTTTQASRSCAEIVAENQSRGRGGRPRGHRRPHDVGAEVTMAMRRYCLAPVDKHNHPESARPLARPRQGRPSTAGILRKNVGAPVPRKVPRRRPAAAEWHSRLKVASY